MLKRSAWLVVAAVLLPLLLLLALQVAYSAREQRRTVESDALAQARVIIAGSDAVIARTLGALDVLSTAMTMRTGDMAGAYVRAADVVRQEPGWSGIVVSRASDHAVLFDTRVPFGTAIPADAALPRNQSFGRVIRTGAGCPCVAVSRTGGGRGGPYLLTVLLSVEPFRRLLPASNGRYEVSGLVTSDGAFIARSINHADRVGRPGSTYLRASVASGRPVGSYTGKTLEGFETFTAFARSPLTGWSAHVAQTIRAVSGPSQRAFGSLALAALLSLAFAALLIAFVVRQMAENRRMTERMQQAQKLEALGQLTGGIAHDFNNLLTPIVGALDILSKREGLDDRARRIAEGGLASANRAAKLTSQLLAFSRQQKLSLKPVELCALIDDIQPLLAQSAGGNVSLVIERCEGPRWVETDPLQLELALLNLIINARDASSAGQSITLRVAVGKLRGRNASQVIVEDSGAGMSSEVQSRAFEPFFTTKQQGRGTGLGLAQVFAFARQSHGEVQIESAPGSGTRVAILLPACPAPEEAPAAAVEPQPASASTFDILVVDDEADVRDTIAVALEEDGHAVTAADSGPAALALLEQRAFALAVVDFAMPHMNGAELIARARGVDPDMRFLVVTGYLDSQAIEAAAPGTPVIAKPFDVAVLRRTVREVASA